MLKSWGDEGEEKTKGKKGKGKTKQWETLSAKLAGAGHRALKTFQTQLLLSK